MRDPLTALAEAYVPDANRADSCAPAQVPEWLVHFLARLIFFLLEPLNAVRLFRSGGLLSVCHERPDLAPGSAQAEAASIRGHFGTAIAWMCRRRGIGPGHPNWPELSRAIVTFGGSLEGYRFDAPACGLQWWENPNIVPGMIVAAPATPAATAIALLLARQAVAETPPPAPNAVAAEAGHARLPAAWLAAAWLAGSWRQGFVRPGTGPPTGPPDARARCLALPTLSCLMHGAGTGLVPLY